MESQSPLSHPALAIRPIVDGRRGGIRESLEAVTLQMARNVAEFLAARVRYPDGEPLRCLVPAHCIGGVAEAAQVDEAFRRQGAGASLSVTPSWAYPLETLDATPGIPKAIWGFNGTERPGAVYLSAAAAAHNQLGDPVFGIYGRDVQDLGDERIPPDVGERLVRFAKAATAVALMRGTAYLALGGVAMGIAASAVDASFFRRYLGMRVEWVDMVEILRRIERGIYDPEEYRRALDWVRQRLQEGEDVNPPERRRTRAQKDRDWETVVKMALVVRDLMVGNPELARRGFGEEALGHYALAAGFQGQRQWTDHWPNGDFMEAILNTSFDWDGPRRPLILATENDALNAATMLFGHLLTDRAQIFADVRTYWSPEAVERVSGRRLSGPAAGGVLHLTNSGAAALDGTGAMRDGEGRPVMKPFWEISAGDIDACLGAVRWCPAVDFFPGGGFSSQYVTRGGMPLTMARISMVHGQGPVLQVVEGYSVELEPDLEAQLSRRTNPTWPATWFVPAAGPDAYQVMGQWGANHCALSYGHVGDRLLTLAAMLRIPVALHNVAPERIFRPSAWALFGSPVAVGADYRACRNFGPLYG